MACIISKFMRPEWLIPSLSSTTKEGVLQEIALHLESNGLNISSQIIFEKLSERERKASTGADSGLAIPHATLPEAENLIIAFGRSVKGVEFGALDNLPSHLFFIVLNPTRERVGETTYLQAISTICRLMRKANVRANLMKATTARQILEVLTNEDILRSQAVHP